MYFMISFDLNQKKLKTSKGKHVKSPLMNIKKISPQFQNKGEESPVNTKKTTQDLHENKIRPSNLNEFLGQSNLKKNLKVFLASSRKRNEPLEHTLFFGPPGLGKTTLSRIMAIEMGANFRISSGPALEKSGDLAAILTNLKEGDVFFIDEIHRLRPAVEEVLYTAMEDFCLDLVVGKGPAARTMRIKIPKFTLVGATTLASLLSSPLRDRFGHHLEIEYYDESELSAIVQRSAKILDINIDSDAADLIAKSARKTPRVANRLLRRVRDFAVVAEKNNIDSKIVNKSLSALGVDELGLDKADRRFLQDLIEKFAGGPVGLSTISSSTGIESGTIEAVIEPYLLRLGFIARTPRGRTATDLAFSHLGIKKRQQSLGI